MVVFALCVFWGFLFSTPGQCSVCPPGCECFEVTQTLECVSSDLHLVPQDIPGYVRTAIITGNNIHQIGPNSFAQQENVTNLVLNNNRITEMASHTFSALTNLGFLDLSANQLALIHPEALYIPGSPLQELNLSHSLFNFTVLTDLTTALRWGGLGGLLHLDLSGNHLALLPPGMFSYIPNLQHLHLSNNSLVTVYSGTFSGMNGLKVLDLRQNAFRTIGADALQELEKLGSIKVLLGNNPYSCSCEIQSFIEWLNKTRAQVDVDAVRCLSPVGLMKTKLRTLTVQAIGCVSQAPSEVNKLTLQTSYVFLGLVLGFVGMVFLFVLYLNRKDMKKWVMDTRDACRDVLEGYHYRYEIDSDPRLANITVDAKRERGNFGITLSQQLPNDTCIIKTPTDTSIKMVTNPPPGNP
ncbi:trophoblast glycoprotein-like [Gouania willdenowi]|uniref:Trophoblast glycoprotein-like n=1 Tax=Gouania willdenowi TaxID=441366 RepID=A0A8C5ESA9_GOUWI|nr:trophoblast glycoprotein-like [Gouania willdenowi]